MTPWHGGRPDQNMGEVGTENKIGYFLRWLARIKWDGRGQEIIRREMKFG